VVTLAARLKGSHTRIEIVGGWTGGSASEAGLVSVGCGCHGAVCPGWSGSGVEGDLLVGMLLGRLQSEHANDIEIAVLRDQLEVLRRQVERVGRGNPDSRREQAFRIVRRCSTCSG
jgi:hypothetical protein